MQPVDVLCNDTSVGTTSTEVRQCIVAQVRFSIQVFCFVMRRQPKLVPPVQRVGQELLASRVGRDKIRPDGVCTSTVGWNSTVHGKTGTSDKQNALGGFKECGKAFHHSRIDTGPFWREESRKRPRGNLDLETRPRKQTQSNRIHLLEETYPGLVQVVLISRKHRLYNRPSGACLLEMPSKL